MIVYPNTKRSSTEDSFTAPEKNDATTRSFDSNWTGYTSALESDIEGTTSTLTENTLSMISTPWTTESWNEDDTNEKLGSSILSWPYSDETMSSTYSSSTAMPKSSSSYGDVSPALHTSGTTVTILNGISIKQHNTSDVLNPLTSNQHSKLPSDTFSSWTVETFTSSGWVTDIDSKVIKAKFPWSPDSVWSATDIYPSTCDTLTSRKGSRVTIATTATFGSRKGETGHINPMNYIGLNHKPGDSPLLKWALQVNRIPMSDALNIIATV